MCQPYWKACWAPRAGWQRGLALLADACATAPRLRRRATTASAADGPARGPPAPGEWFPPGLSQSLCLVGWRPTPVLSRCHCERSESNSLPGTGLAEASPKLCQRQLAVAIRCNRLAAFAEFRMAAAIAHDAPHLLAFDIAVDSSHPRVDLGKQQTFASFEHMVGPGHGALRGGLDTSQTTLAREADQARHPISAVFDRPREIAEPGMRPHHHQEIRKAVDQDAEKGLWPVRPFRFQRHAVDAADIDAVESAGDRVEPGGVDDDVELVLGVAGLDTARSNALDRGLGKVNELDIGLVVDFEVAAFERHPPGAEPVIFRD